MALLDRKTVWTGVGHVYLGDFNETTGKAAMGFIVNPQPVGCRTVTLALSPSVETNVITSTCEIARGPLRTPPSSSEMAVTLTLEEFDVQALARYYLGAAALKSGGSEADEHVAAKAKDEIFFLSHPDVSNVVIKDSAGAPNTLSKGTDYDVVGKDGDGVYKLLKAVTDDPLHVAYDYDDSVNIPTLSAFAKTSSILFIGENADGERARIAVPKVNLMPQGEFNWISVDGSPSQLQLGGQALAVDALAQGDYGPFARVTVW